MRSRTTTSLDAKMARNALMKELAELPVTDKAKARARAANKAVSAREAIAQARPAVAPASSGSNSAIAVSSAPDAVADKA